MAFGTQVIGRFDGVKSDEYRSFLLVKVQADSPEKSGYVEKIEYVAFSPKTGKKMLPDNLKSGDVICVGVYLDAVRFVRDGKENVFVTKKAKYVELLKDSAWL